MYLFSSMLNSKPPFGSFCDLCHLLWPWCASYHSIESAWKTRKWRASKLDTDHIFIEGNWKETVGRRPILPDSTICFGCLVRGMWIDHQWSLTTWMAPYIHRSWNLNWSRTLRFLPDVSARTKPLSKFLVVIFEITHRSWLVINLALKRATFQSFKKGSGRKTLKYGNKWEFYTFKVKHQAIYLSIYLT